MRTSLNSSSSTVRFFTVSVAALALAGAAHCGSTDSSPAEPPDTSAGTSAGGGTAAAGSADTGGTSAAAGSDAGTAGAAGSAIEIFNHCANEPDGGAGGATAGAGIYADLTDPAADRSIVEKSLHYTPNCLVITEGESVTWNTDFSAHPLNPGRPGDMAGTVSGSPNSPIVLQTGGATFTATFPTAGFYPFYCSMHGFDDNGDGNGMVGTVQVIAATK